MRERVLEVFQAALPVALAAGPWPPAPPPAGGRQFLGLVLHQVQKAGAIRSLALQVFQQEPDAFAQAGQLGGHHAGHEHGSQ